MKTLLLGLMTALSISRLAMALPTVQTFGEVRQQVLEEGWLVTPKPQYPRDNTRTLAHVESGYSEVAFCAPITAVYPECTYLYVRLDTSQYVIIRTIPNPNPRNPISNSPENDVVIEISVHPLP